MCYICGDSRACGNGMGSSQCVPSIMASVPVGGGCKQCITSVVAAMPVGVCPLWEWVVVVGSVLHLWRQPCLWECVLCGNGWRTVCYIWDGSCACGSVPSVGMGDGQCVTSVVAAVLVGMGGGQCVTSVLFGKYGGVDGSGHFPRVNEAPAFLNRPV